MSETAVQRRLAAILTADVVGFSSHMGRDEEGTLARLKRLRRELIEPKIQIHHGRIFKTTGDGFLAEFSSPVEAVRCALEVQDTLAAETAHEPAKALQLRIGVNLGDIIIEEDGDVYGDGVNVAARLEQLAEPGGISISGSVYDQIEGKIDRTFENRGEQQVKNIARPVRVYALGGADPTVTPKHAKSLPHPDRPSLAVLPFTNMSGDPEQEYFADGVVEDIITALSRIRWFFVIARNSSFTYKGKAVDIRQVGRELGVRYVLEGSIRRAGNKLRITGQLIEAATGSHIWADRFDGELDDIFDLQDRITQDIVAAIEPNIRAVEIKRARSKPTESLDAYDLYLRALPEFHSYTEQGFKKAQAILEQAVARDPDYADAWGALADCIGRLIMSGWVKDREAATEKVRNAAARAVETGSENGWALANAAWAYALTLGNTPKALLLADQALRLHPNSAHVLMQSAVVLMYGGELDRAFDAVEKARRISPLDTRSYTIFATLAGCYYFSHRYEEAIAWANRAIGQSPSFPVAYRFLAAALAQLGRLDEARAAVDKLIEVQPTSSLTLSRTAAYVQPLSDLYVDGLRKAGLPE
jgi:adenylate cyclase